jgi:hypothetical protein
MDALEPIRSFLESVPRGKASTDVALRRSLNEEWLSDTLAWLLDPKGSHGYGVDFVEAFVKRVARRRSRGDHDYERRATHLKFGQGGRGRGSTTFNLGNATSLREFYLASTVGPSGTGSLESSRYCDVVLADLDSGDDFLMVIENKLFTTNRPGQLSDYLHTVEDRYDRVSCREYVYLTLDGHDPVAYDGEDSETYDRWVRISWVDDILPLLEELGPRGDDELARLIGLLRWLRRLMLRERDASIDTDDIEAFRRLVVEASARCLHEELSRLLADGKGSWRIERTSKHSARLVHSINHSRYLYAEMLPNYSITLQTRRDGRAYYDKMLVPFGAPSDQIYNLLDISARDIYYRHFNDASDYLGDKRRLTATVTPNKREYRPVFDFLHERRFELEVMLTLSEHVWEAARDVLEVEQRREGESKATAEASV